MMYENAPSVQKFADINKNQQNAISYLNDSNYWQEKYFFITLSPNES